jgi:hypothetical protein
MGNKKTKREAGQLLKQYGLPKQFTYKKYPRTSQAKFIRDVLSLTYGDLVYDYCTKMNHRAIGFLEEHERWEGPCRGYKPRTMIYHLVYEGNLLGSGAFDVDPPQKDALTCNALECPEVVERLLQEERISYADTHCGDFMELKK